jgi:hypothetical protein
MNEDIIFQAALSPGSKVTWEGQIHPIQIEHQPYEVDVYARGSSFHMLIGSHAYGNFVCIPNWNVGSELAGLADTVWNGEHLHETTLRRVDASSVVYALRELSKYLPL